MRLLLALSFIFLFFAAGTPVFAGGGPFGLEAFVLKPFDQTKAFIVAARLYIDNCDNAKISVKLEDQKNGDSITSFTPPADGSYIERHFFTGNPENTWKKICMQYFQVKSSEERQRTVIATATSNGKTYTADYQLAFGNDAYSKEIQGFDRYNNQPQSDVVSEKYLGGPKREVNVQWNTVEDARKYGVFARELRENGDLVDLPVLLITEGNKGTINLSSELEFYLSAQVCQDDACTKGDNPYEVILSKMRTGGKMDSSETNTVITPKAIPDEGNVTMKDEKRIEELNKKVSDLEGKLEKSQKQQNLLEQKLNDILQLLRSLFPFLR